MPVTWPRGNRKKLMSTMELLDELGLREEMEAVAARYRPQLEAWGVLDGLCEWQEMVLWYELCMRERRRHGEIRDRG